MADKNTIDSPVSDYNGKKGPGAALNTPVKSYPENTARVMGGAKVTIEGPGSDHYGKK